MAGNDTKTVLLLPFQGYNGEFSVLDESLGASTPHTITSDAQISTDTNKFDESSLLCIGGGQSAVVSPHADFAFGANDFTIDFWIKTNDINQTYGWAWYQDKDNYFGMELYPSSLSTTKFFIGFRYRYNGVTIFSIPNIVIIASSFTHIALVRYTDTHLGNLVRAYINGYPKAAGNSVSGQTYNAHMWPLYIGKGVYEPTGELRGHNGYIDEFRVHLGDYFNTDGGAFVPPTHSYSGNVHSLIRGSSNIVSPTSATCHGESGVGLYHFGAYCSGVSQVSGEMSARCSGQSTIINVNASCTGSSKILSQMSIVCSGGSSLEPQVVASCSGRSNVTFATFSSLCSGRSDVDRIVTANITGSSGITRNYTPSVPGVSTIETSTVEYRLYHRIGAEVNDSDFSSTPFRTFAALPEAFALTGAGIHYFVLRRANRYGMESQNIEQSIIELDATNTQLTLIPSAPKYVSISPIGQSKLRLNAYYIYGEDSGREATHFRAWVNFGVAPADPDPDIDVAIETVAMIKSDGVAKYELISGVLPEGNIVKAVVRCVRLPEGRDDGNVSIVSDSATSIGPPSPSVRAFHSSRGERKMVT